MMMMMNGAKNCNKYLKSKKYPKIKNESLPLFIEKFKLFRGIK